MIWLTNRSRVPEWLIPTDPGLAALPRSVHPFFFETHVALTELGFSLVSVLHENNLAPGFSTWATLYVNRVSRERAVAHAHIPTKEGLPATPKASVYFVTNWTDGRLIETANSRHVSPFPRVPDRESWQFPDVSDPRVLYRIHQRRSAALGSAPRDFPAEGAEVAYLTKAMADFYQVHVWTGYLRAVEPGRVFRPTARGAFLMTWTQLPPMSWIARRRRKLRNQAYLSEHHLQAG
jgi:hypothetical protein